MIDWASESLTPLDNSTSALPEPKSWVCVTLTSAIGKSLEALVTVDSTACSLFSVTIKFSTGPGVDVGLTCTRFKVVAPKGSDSIPSWFPAALCAVRVYSVLGSSPVMTAELSDAGKTFSMSPGVTRNMTCETSAGVGVSSPQVHATVSEVCVAVIAEIAGESGQASDSVPSH